MDDDFDADEVCRLMQEEVEWQQEEWRREILEQFNAPPWAE